MESRSTFVTVLAWIFIVGTGFASLISIMQVIMISTMFSGDAFKSMPEDAPAMAKFMSQYFHFVVYGFCALVLLTFVSSIALLKRKNWARLVFVVILSIGVFGQVGGLIMQFTVFSTMPMPTDAEGFEKFELISKIMLWFSVAISIIISGLFIWLIKKLVTQPIISEFTLNKSSNSDAVNSAGS